MAQPVSIVFFTQSIGAPDSVWQARRAIAEVTATHPDVTMEEANLVLDRDRAAALGIDRVPAIALQRGGDDTGIRFLGAPEGHELASLADAVALASQPDSGLSTTSKALIAEHVTGPMRILVFVTPTCVYCPQAVALANRMALESPLISSYTVQAMECLDLSQRYRVTGVPKTVVDGTTREVFGAVPEEEFVRGVLGLSPVTPPAR